jgi:hypothetical protein
MRQNVTNKLQILINKEIIEKERRPTYKIKQENQEKKPINNIKNYMIQNNLIATRADKGNTIVILHQDEYNQKISDYNKCKPTCKCIVFCSFCKPTFSGATRE